MNVTTVAAEVIGLEIAEAAQGEEEVIVEEDITIGEDVMTTVIVTVVKGEGVTFVMSMVIWPATAAISAEVAEAAAGVPAGAQDVVIAEAAADLLDQAADLIEEAKAPRERTKKRTETDLAHHQLVIPTEREFLDQEVAHHHRTMNKLISVP